MAAPEFLGPLPLCLLFIHSNLIQADYCSQGHPTTQSPGCLPYPTAIWTGEASLATAPWSVGTCVRMPRGSSSVSGYQGFQSEHRELVRSPILFSGGFSNGTATSTACTLVGPDSGDIGHTEIQLSSPPERRSPSNCSPHPSSSP